MAIQTRKHATIMFTDIVGYAALKGSNEDVHSKKVKAQGDSLKFY